MMLKAEHIETYGWEAAIRGARNPMNSWAMSDSIFCDMDKCETCRLVKQCREERSLEYQDFYIGERDLDLMRRLVKAGRDHGKFMRMIGISMDIVAPLYWWKEYDTYKVGTVADSCSTMHKIAEKEFTLDDFSHEHLIYEPLQHLEDTVELLNEVRTSYLNYDRWKSDGKLIHNAPEKKNVWWQMIQLLPSSYNQRRTVTLNYAVARNMYHARKNHKLDEWHTLCEVFEKLPYSELITEV